MLSGIKVAKEMWMRLALTPMVCALVLTIGCAHHKTLKDLKHEAQIAELTLAVKAFDGPAPPDCVVDSKPHACPPDTRQELERLLNSSLTQIIFSYEDRRMWAEAEPFHRQRLSRLPTALHYYLLGRNLQRQRKSGPAIEVFKEGLRVCEPMFERNLKSATPSQIASELDDLADLYTQLKQYPAAEERYRRALEIFSSEKGPTSEEVEHTLLSYSLMLGNVSGRDEDRRMLQDRYQALYRERAAK